MPHSASEPVRVLRTAAWIWVGYLACLTLVDAYIYAGRPLLPILWYHLVDGLPAAVFLGLSYSPWSQNRTTTILPWMIGLITLMPILMTHLFNLRLPAAPLSNIEGMVLRQTPVLFIALILVAWHYNLAMMLLYSLGVNLFEWLAVIWFEPFDSERLTSFYFLSIVRAVSFVVVGLFINQLVTRLRSQQEALQTANAELAHYASTLETLATSRERNRLARELHDTLAHTLSGLSVQLETAKAYWEVQPETTYQLLIQSLNTTRSGLDETRRALKALRASPLEDLGLRLALQELSTSAAERCQLNLTLNLPEQIPTLSPDVEQCVYRVAQEAIENVINHANASQLSVQLGVQESGVFLVVQDNGVGADFIQTSMAAPLPASPAARPTGHFGLVGMQERAQLVGGQLTISSRPNQGTRIELFIPRIPT